ncbi:MAG: hypothetical protein HN400_17160 [Nitrospinaceae bacterium]|nr:hypothetical protein [Nitrospinaceae bacterium]
MAKFSGKTTVENFEREFFKTFEMLCDVLKDGKPAVDSARLSSLRSKDFSGDKEGVFEAAGNMQVGNAKKRFEEAFGLQLEIYRTEPAPSDVTLASLRLDRGRRNPPKGELSASGRMSVEKFEEAFEDAFWVSAKVVDKGNPADPKTRLASLRTDDFDGPKAAELTIRGNMKVGNVIAALKENLGIVVVALALAPADNRTTLASLRAIGVPSIKPDEKIVVGKRLEEFSGHKYLFMFEQPEEVEYYLDDIFENDSEKSDALEQALDAVKALFEKFQQAAVEARFDEGDQVFLPLKDGENIKLIAVLDIFDGSFELEKIYFKFSSVTCIFLTQGNDDWDYNFLKLNESMGIDFSVVGPHPEFDEMVFQRYEDGYYDEGILSASDDEKDLFCGIRRFSDFYFSLLNSRASSEDFSLLNSRASSEENPDELKAVIDERGGGEEGGENDPTFSILSQEIKRLVDTQIVVDLKNEMPRLTDGRFKDVFCEVNVYPKLEDDGFGSETKNLFVQVTFFVAADSKIDSFDTLSRMTLTELFFSDPDMCEEISKELT